MKFLHIRAPLCNLMDIKANSTFAQAPLLSCQLTFSSLDSGLLSDKATTACFLHFF
jgi:hypothetical protein